MSARKFDFDHVALSDDVDTAVYLAAATTFLIRHLVVDKFDDGQAHVSLDRFHAEVIHAVADLAWQRASEAQDDLVRMKDAPQ